MGDKLVYVMAACLKNGGIGLDNGSSPWYLPKEISHFAVVTKFVNDKKKRNAIVMDLDTWKHIPIGKKPLINRLNVVLTNKPDDLPKDVLAYESLDVALSHLKDMSDIEKIWIIGGAPIYKEAIDKPISSRIYLTEIDFEVECKYFFPEFKDKFNLLADHGDESELVPIEQQHEVVNGTTVTYYYRIYERK